MAGTAQFLGCMWLTLFFTLRRGPTYEIPSMVQFGESPDMPRRNIAPETIVKTQPQKVRTSSILGILHDHETETDMRLGGLREQN